ncbi:hypothetical protein N566_02995, partial [Streptomycetaceae bacterium MP113-05]
GVSDRTGPGAQEPHRHLPEAAPPGHGPPATEGTPEMAAPAAEGGAVPQVADEGPQPLGLRVEATGHPPVDAQLRRLDDAGRLAVSGHLEVYEDVHRGLRDTLTALDRNESRS